MIAISTAFETAQVAIQRGNKTFFKELDANCKHSENLLRTIDECLAELGLDIREEEDFAVVVGTGSFTGLRIGIATVKGICAGLGRGKVVPISSLDLIAYSYVKRNKVTSDFVVVMDALSGLRFVCKYNKEGQPISQPSLVKAEEVDLMPEEKVSAAGNLSHKSTPLTCEDLLEFALKHKDKSCDYHLLTPLYLRKSQAEVGLEEKMLKKI